MKKLPYGRHHIEEEDIAAITKVLRSDFLTQGPAVEDFEKALAKFLNAKHVIAVSNGTTALHLAAAGLGVKSGDWALCTPNTFVASANCIRYCGGEVDFVDIDPANHCLDLDLLEKKLANGERTWKGIVAVDFAGYPVDFERLRKIADKYSLWIIEDACHALGAEFKNSKGQWIKSGNGTYADASVFSFHPVKHIATGEGGAVVTNNDEVAARVRLLRSHGITRDPQKISHPDQGWYYEMQELGFNYRLPDLNAVLGSSQLKRIDSNLARRREIASLYDEAFAPKGWVHPEKNREARHAYHLYTIEVPDRKGLYDFLKTKNIFSQVHYIPVHQQPYYKTRYGQASLPVCDSYYSKTLSLPMYPQLTNEDVKFVISSVLEFFKS